MKINVTENKVSIKEEQILNENEYNIHKIQFDFSSEYTDDLVKVALFSIDNHTYKKIISNNECDIPPEVLTQRGYSILGVYAYKAEQDTLVLRYSPSPTRISVYDGSYKAEAENSEPITPSEIEQYQQILQNSLQQFQNQYNALVEETEGDIQAIENELQRKVDEGYFDGEDGFSPIATVTQLQNGARIEIEDENGRTSADVLNGQDGYSPVRGVDYWTEEDKQEVEEEATQQIEGKIEEYNENAAEKLNQYNQNATQKTTDYNTNASEKLSLYNQNATQKTNAYDTNASDKLTAYNTNATQKVTDYNTNANNKTDTYNSNATQKINAYDTNASDKLENYNTNATQKLNAYNTNATEKTQAFDEHTEEIQEEIEKLQTENARFKATLPTTTGEGQAITLNKTAEMEFVKPPLPRGNSEQESTTGKNLLPRATTSTETNGITFTVNNDGTIVANGTATGIAYFNLQEKTLEAGTYILSGCPSGGGSNTYRIITKYGNNYQTDSGNGKTFTLTEETTPTERYIAISNGTTVNNLIFKPMIRLSSIQESNYEPYTGGIPSPSPDYPQEITNVTGDVEVLVQNKNLCNGINQGYYLTMNTSICGKSTKDNGLVIKVDGTSNYTVSTKATQTRFRVACLNSLPLLDGSVTTYNGANRDGTSNSITIDTNGYKYLIVNVTDLSSIQIEKGTTATTYIAHKEQTLPLTLGNIELCKIGDYQDYLYKSNNKWYKHSEIGKVVLDGTENWEARGTSTTLYQLAQTGIKHPTENNKKASLVSNFFETLAYYVNGTTDIFGDNNGISYPAIDNLLLIKNLSVNSLETFKAWLNEHNTKVYYVLQAPTDIEITDTTLISQLEAINDAISYEEQTNISSNQNAIFDVEAYQSTKLVLQDFATAIVALGGV